MDTIEWYRLFTPVTKHPVPDDFLAHMDAIDWYRFLTHVTEASGS